MQSSVESEENHNHEENKVILVHRFRNKYTTHLSANPIAQV